MLRYIARIFCTPLFTVFFIKTIFDFLKTKKGEENSLTFQATKFTVK
jgi:hypothetical protein